MSFFTFLVFVFPSFHISSLPSFDTFLTSFSLSLVS
jgi:hypothetical protein